MDKNMETIQSTERSHMADRAASLGGILLVLTAFIAPLVVLPWMAIASLPKLSSAIEVSSSSPTAILLTVLVSLCFIGFISAVVSIAASFMSRNEAHSPLPLKTLVLQSLCLVFSVGAFLFLG